MKEEEEEEEEGALKLQLAHVVCNGLLLNLECQRLAGCAARRYLVHLPVMHVAHGVDFTGTVPLPCAALKQARPKQRRAGVFASSALRRRRPDLAFVPV